MIVLKMGGGDTVKYIRVLPLFWKSRMKGLNFTKKIPGLAQISTNFVVDNLSNKFWFFFNVTEFSINL